MVSAAALFADAELVEMRNELREKNLHDTEEPPLEEQEIPPNLDPAIREGADDRRDAQRSAVPEDGRRRAAASAATSRSSTRSPTRRTC